MKKSLEAQEKFIELRVKGLSFDRIAKELRVSKPTLITWSKEFQTEIINLRSLEMDRLKEELNINFEQRIAAISQTKFNLWTELSSRNLKDVPTEKLLELFLKVNTYLDKVVPVTSLQERTIFDDLGSTQTWAA